MLSKVASGAIYGVNGYTVMVEVDLAAGLPSFDIVGLPDTAVKESRERVRTAVNNSNYPFPIRRITVNLAPADTKKEGPSFDLPISVGILICMDIVPAHAAEGVLFLGELSLDGAVRPVSGILPIIHSANLSGLRKCVVPYDNADEAALVAEMEVIGVKSLSEVIKYLSGKEDLKRTQLSMTELFKREKLDTYDDFSDVKGQDNVKRALEIAAAGGHNVLMIGPPGSGKTMMAWRLPSILPDLTFDESLEVTKIYSVAGHIKNKNSLITNRPFRSPHHTISYSALTGGGRIPKPGEISLAHNGILFLDELPEFSKNVLEVLRQPMEDRFVTISRVGGTITYPSNFMLIAAMNPCPCGYYRISTRCVCKNEEVIKYKSRISGPLMDRLDIHVEAAPVQYNDISGNRKPETSAEIKKRVKKAHNIQLNRYKNENIFFNSSLNASQIETYCELGNAEKEIIKSVFVSLNLSGRSYHKILKIARTIADLDGVERIAVPHIAEAIQYRSFDRID